MLGVDLTTSVRINYSFSSTFMRSLLTLWNIFSETTAMNPQFVVQIPRGTGSKCHVVVAVTQQYGQASSSSSSSQGTLTTSNNKESKSGRPSFHAIGFAVYEARPNMHRITTHFVTENV